MMGFSGVLGKATMRNLIKTFLVMLMLSFSHAAIAGDLEDGIAAFEKGDFAAALRLWTPLAEQGDANAQLLLGSIYQKGDGVAQDYNTAVKWYTLSAEQGNISAQVNLGVMYDQGQGVAQDYKTAVKWFTLAAEQGIVLAQSILGVSYADGKGVAQDYVKAHMWLNIAAIDGYAQAIKGRDIVAEQMTPAQIAEAQKAANRCIKQNFKNCD
jgi:TPR repeat protein